MNLKIPHIWISLPTPLHGGFGIQFYHPDGKEELKKFTDLMWTFSDKHNNFRFFHQGNQPNWQYFEALGRSDQDIIFNFAMELAEIFNLELEIH